MLTSVLGDQTEQRGGLLWRPGMLASPKFQLFRVEVVCLQDGGEQRCSVAEIERAELALEILA
jgi:hypothetical protein